FAGDRGIGDGSAQGGAHPSAFAAEAEESLGGVSEDLDLHPLARRAEKLESAGDGVVDAAAFRFDGLHGVLPKRSTGVEVGLEARPDQVRVREIAYCWPIVSRLFTSQYSVRPAGKLMNMKVNTTGMIIIARCCAGSPADGVIHCCTSMLTPITRVSTGMPGWGTNGSWIEPRRSGAERSVIQPTKGAWRSSTAFSSAL